MFVAFSENLNLTILVFFPYQFLWLVHCSKSFSFLNMDSTKNNSNLSKVLYQE